MDVKIKKRYWAFVVYPESLPSDWRETLQLQGVPVAVSPLHDKDVNADGTLKKPHYHILMAFNSPTTYNNVYSLSVTSLHGVRPQWLQSPKGYFKYLCHEDNPEKYQYDKKDIVIYSGIKEDFCPLSSDDITEILRSIFKFIDDVGIYEYSDLIDILRVSNKDNEKEMFHIAVTHTLVLNSYISSRRNKLKKQV